MPANPALSRFYTSKTLSSLAASAAKPRRLRPANFNHPPSRLLSVSTKYGPTNNVFSQVDTVPPRQARRLHLSPVRHKTPNTSTPSIYAHLPELKLPEPVKYVDRSTPLITKPEVEEYFVPLFLRGWSLVGLSLDESSPKTPFLMVNLACKGLKSSRKLLRHLLLLEEQEKHHTSFHLWSTEKTPNLMFLTQTHSARHYDPEGSISPGITLRDIRMAVLLQRFAETSNLLNPEELSGQLDEEAWNALLASYPWPSES